MAIDLRGMGWVEVGEGRSWFGWLGMSEFWKDVDSMTQGVEYGYYLSTSTYHPDALT